VEIKIPSYKEQKEIANILDAWDTTIENIEQLIGAKEKQFQWLIKSLISDQCQKWQHLASRKMFASISIKNHPNEELLSVTQDKGAIPRKMLEGRVMSPEGSTSSYKLIEKGDFIISLRSFQGGIEHSDYKGIVSPAYTVLRNRIPIHHEFYKLFFKSYLFVEKYLRIAVIGIRDGKQISLPDFESVKIPYPPIEKQKEIASILNAAQQEINILKKQAEAYRIQKCGLTQKLLTGKWRVRINVQFKKQERNRNV
jgi:type I restriction enzyme S subunit